MNRREWLIELIWPAMQVAGSRAPFYEATIHDAARVVDTADIPDGASTWLLIERLRQSIENWEQRTGRRPPKLLSQWGTIRP